MIHELLGGVHNSALLETQGEQEKQAMNTSKHGIQNT